MKIESSVHFNYSDFKSFYFILPFYNIVFPGMFVDLTKQIYYGILVCILKMHMVEKTWSTSYNVVLNFALYAVDFTFQKNLFSLCQ